MLLTRGKNSFMKILITGHKGFIGNVLFNRLCQKDHKVTGLDLINNQDLLTYEFTEDFDLVIHLAGKSGVRESINDPAGYWKNNVEVSKRLFARYSKTRILYASSSSAYESDLNPYAASKYIVEQAADRYPNTLGMRFHTVYSDLPRKGMFLDKLINNQLEYVTTHHRDFIHIEDLCDAIELLIESQLNGILDIGTGESVKVQTLTSGLPIRLNTVHERQYTKANIEKLTNLGFKPKYNIRKFLTNKNLGTII